MENEIKYRRLKYDSKEVAVKSYIIKQYKNRGKNPFLEHKHNLKQGLFEKSKLTQHMYEEGHHIKWDEAKAIRKEPNTTHRK
jgi:hypothetical protein